MKHLIIFWDCNFEARGRELAQYYSVNTDYAIHTFTSADIDNGFYISNKYILDQKKGAGYWLWKPYFILRVMNEAGDGDTIIYTDCGDRIIDFTVFGKIVDIMGTFFVSGYFKNKFFTKRDCFVGMFCDCPACAEMMQLEAGMIVLANNAKNRGFVKRWLNQCKNKRILTDEDSINENYQGFIMHRHDQSILTNMVFKESRLNDVISINLMDKIIAYNE